MTRIVTSTYRYKRPPRKRKAVLLEGPASVRRGGTAKPETPPANDDRTPAVVTKKRVAKADRHAPAKSVIVMARRPGA